MNEIMEYMDDLDRQIMRRWHTCAASVEKIADNLGVDRDYVFNLITHPSNAKEKTARETYKEMLAQAQKVCEEAITPAMETYKETESWEAYKKVVIQILEAYKEAIDSALKTHKEAAEQAWEAYEQSKKEER